MKALLRFAKVVDRFSEWQGGLSVFLVILVIIVGFYNVATRFAGRYIGVQLASNSYIELQEHLFSAIFLLGFAYILKHHVNVRVDFFYSHWSIQRRALVDFLGTVLVLVPLCLLGMFVTWNPLLRAWREMETSGDAGGLIQGPVRTMLFAGFFLLLLQSLSQAIKYWAATRGNQAAIDSLVADSYGQTVVE